MAADYSGIIASVVSVLKADTNLTGASGLLAAFDPNGVSPSRANSIFYQRPPVPKPPTPCIVLADIDTGPADAAQHEEPAMYADVLLVLYVFGASDAIRPVTFEIDRLLEPAWYGGAMDTADWQINDIDTRRSWKVLAADEELTDSNGVAVEQRAKVYVIKAASLAA